MGALVHLYNPFDPTKRNVYRLDKPVTVRRLLQKHKGLRPHTQVYRPGGAYGRRRVREFSRQTVCLFNGQALTRKEWKRTVVGAGDVVAFYAPPAGGGALRIVATAVIMIAIAVAAPYLGGLIAPFIGSAGAALGVTIGAGTALSIGTALAGIALSAIAYGVMSLFTSPAPPTSSGTGYNSSTPTSSPVYNLQAQGNFARLGQPIPEPFGRNRLFPDFITQPYATFVNVFGFPGTNDMYLRHIVALGIGEYEIDEDSLKLGDTPLSSYGDAVEWQVIAPGEYSDTDIADERWLTCQDVAQVEMLDEAAGSPWNGPFAANPSGTLVDRIEVDFIAPRGLWAFNPVSTGYDGQHVYWECEAQKIDDDGEPIGDPDVWENLTPDPIHYIGQSDVAQRFTEPFLLPEAARWRVRVRRVDTKSTSLQAGHQFDWIGLRGRLLFRRNYPGMTCIALKMRGSAALNASQARQFNLIATRKLSTWDEEAGAMGTALIATRSPCDAFAYIGRTSNGGRLRDAQIGLAELYAHKADFAEKGWTFDFVFDTATTVSEALARVARAVVGERVVQGGKVHLVRDVPVTAPVAMFSPRNIAPGSFSAQYVMRDSTSPDALIGTFIDQKYWKPRDVTVAFPDSAQERPSRLTLHGVGSRDQARAVLWNLARADRYRRRVVGWQTAMEGLAVTFGDGISMSHDVPKYGQTLEVIDVDNSDPNAPILTFNDTPDFSDPAATYYAAVRDNLGRKAGPFVATPVDGQPDQVQLTVPDPEDLPEILIGGDRERTWIQLGPGEAYAKRLKVKMVSPQQDGRSATIVAYDDDPRMYDPLPDEPEVPIGADLSPIEITIAAEDGPVVNLRTLANANDYVGLAIQQVTFTLPLDVDVTIVRGSWPSTAQPILDLVGTASGATGTAGAGGIGGTPNGSGEGGSGLPGVAGGPGGPAIDSSSGPLKIIGGGTIRGGKGGGGGGGGGAGLLADNGEGGFFQLSGGTGGAGNGSAGSAGASFGADEAGAGGTGGSPGASYATAGTAGSTGGAATSGDAVGGAGGAGGAAGKAIVGIANVDLSEFAGSIIGSTA